jgi:Mn-containing catalase
MIEIPHSKIEISTFSLMRTKKDCYYPPIQVDFTPLKRVGQSSTGSDADTISILPRFNKDGNFFTPSFLNPYEEVLVDLVQNRRIESQGSNIEIEKEKFLKKI